MSKAINVRRKALPLLFAVVLAAAFMAVMPAKAFADTGTFTVVDWDGDPVGTGTGPGTYDGAIPGQELSTVLSALPAPPGFPVNDQDFYGVILTSNYTSEATLKIDGTNVIIFQDGYTLTVDNSTDPTADGISVINQSTVHILGGPLVINAGHTGIVLDRGTLNMVDDQERTIAGVDYGMHARLGTATIFGTVSITGQTGGYFSDYSVVTITGDLTGTSGAGVVCMDAGTNVFIEGNVTGTISGISCQQGEVFVWKGNVTATDGGAYGIGCTNGGTVRVYGGNVSSNGPGGIGVYCHNVAGESGTVEVVEGNVSGGYIGVSCVGDGTSFVLVNDGDVVGANTSYGVLCQGNGNTVNVIGNVSGGQYGVGCYIDGNVLVGGNVVATEATGTGVYCEEGFVGVNGTITAFVYISVGDPAVVKAFGDFDTASIGSIPDGYRVYTDTGDYITATAGVYVAIPYTLTVVNGTGSGTYTILTVIPITAGTAPAGQVFDKWVTSGGGSFADENNASTMFTMPAGDVTVTATYKALGSATPGTGDNNLMVWLMVFTTAILGIICMLVWLQRRLRSEGR